MKRGIEKGLGVIVGLVELPLRRCIRRVVDYMLLLVA